MNILANDLSLLAGGMLDIACEVIFKDEELQELQTNIRKDVKKYQQQTEEL